MCVCERERMYVCERERICVCETERMCICVYVREREIERERESVCLCFSAGIYSNYSLYFIPRKIINLSDTCSSVL